MNQGARLAKGRLLLFLNNDVLVGEDALARLAAGWKRLPKAGGLSPSLGMLKLTRAQFAAAPARALARQRAFAWTVARFFGDETRTTDYFVNGACFLTSRAAFEEVGGFDERFFPGGYEDIDLQLRLTNAGYALGWDIGTYVHHFQSTSFGRGAVKRAASDAANLRRFTRLWKGRRVRLPRMRRFLESGAAAP